MKTIEDCNVMIARYMGGIIGGGSMPSGMRMVYLNEMEWSLVKDLGYDTDWLRLMPVVEKIEESTQVEIIGNKNHHTCRLPFDDIRTTDENKLKAVWLAVVEYIEKYWLMQDLKLKP